MTEYPIHFHPGSGDTSRGRLPRSIAISHRLALAGKKVCVPAQHAGTPVLRLCTQEEYRLWQESVQESHWHPVHERLLQLLAYHLTPPEHSLVLSNRLLAFASITTDAVLRIQEDGSIWLTAKI